MFQKQNGLVCNPHKSVIFQNNRSKNNKTQVKLFEEVGWAKTLKRRIKFGKFGTRTTGLLPTPQRVLSSNWLIGWAHLNLTMATSPLSPWKWTRRQIRNLWHRENGLSATNKILLHLFALAFTSWSIFHRTRHNTTQRSHDAMGHAVCRKSSNSPPLNTKLQASDESARNWPHFCVHNFNKIQKSFRGIWSHLFWAVTDWSLDRQTLQYRMTDM